MKKRIFKQGMALMLAAALALPANVVPAEILDQQTETCLLYTSPGNQFRRLWKER